MAEPVTLVFVGVPTIEVESGFEGSGLLDCKMTGPRPKFVGKLEKTKLLDGAGVAAAMAVKFPATFV